MKKIPFKCLRCGDCCRKVARGQKFGMPLMRTEADRLRILAMRHMIDLELKPLTTNGLWVTTYQMTQNPCVFLRAGECLVYPYRPLVCQMYPFHPKGLSPCKFLDLYARGKPIGYPESVKMAAISYSLEVAPLLRGCTKRYNLNKGWERPYEDNKKYMILDL